MIHYQGPSVNEGLNLTVERMKSPVEYIPYNQAGNAGSSVVTSMPTNTPGDAKFAQIAPLLSQGIIHRQHNPNLDHQGMTHSQSVVVDDRLLMTAPAAHHRKEDSQPHELVLRGPGVVQQHSSQHQQHSVISNTASLNASVVESPSAEEYRERRSAIETIHRPSSVERARGEPTESKHVVEEPIQTSPYSSKYRYANEGCFQTVLQVKK